MFQYKPGLSYKPGLQYKPGGGSRSLVPIEAGACFRNCMVFTVSASSYCVLKMSALHMNIMHFMLYVITPLVNSDVNNVLVKIEADLIQPLLQFVNAVDVCLVTVLTWSPISDSQLGCLCATDPAE